MKRTGKSDSLLTRSCALAIALVSLSLVSIVLTVHVQAAESQEDVARKIDRIFQDWDADDRPGGTIGVIRDGELVYVRGFGMANLEHAVPSSPETVFRIASVSKQFVACCVLMLAARGELSLDDPLDKHFPEMPPYAAQIHFEHLLHHTSGLRDYLALHSLAGARDHDWYTPDDSIAMIARQQGLMFEPGSRYSYSNSNYLLAAHLIERVTGSTLREFAAANIFGPLGMDNTRFHDRHNEVIPNRADGYVKEGDAWHVLNTSLDHVGDGGVFTTVEDLARWDANFYEPKLEGGTELIEAMLTTTTLSGGTAIPYARGLVVSQYRGQKTVRHGGAFVGFRAELLRFPEQKLTIIVLANHTSANPSRRANQLADALLEGHLSEPVTSTDSEAIEDQVESRDAPMLSAEEMAAYLGAYENDELPAVYEITLLENGLGLKSPNRSVGLKAIEKDVFQMTSLNVRFLRDGHDRVDSLVVEHPRTGEIVFRREQ